MSHHFDSPTAIADGRINLCDLYVFPATPDTTTLIMTVNPDAGRSSPTTFRPDARYEFVVATDGGLIEDLVFKFLFAGPDTDGRQAVRVLRAENKDADHGSHDFLLGEGRTGEVIHLREGSLAWVGLAADPFAADGPSLFTFLQAIAEGRFAPDVFATSPVNVFAGRDVTAIALRIPNTSFASTHLTVWARISLYGHAPEQQVSRMGQPMLRPLFFPSPDEETEALNRGAPATDRDLHGQRVHGLAITVARLAGFHDPGAHAERVTAAFLPDVLRYRPDRPTGFYPGSGNGRSLSDDAFDIGVEALVGSPLANASRPRPARPEFPFLNPPQPGDLPALAELFGLREFAPTEQR